MKLPFRVSGPLVLVTGPPAVEPILLVGLKLIVVGLALDNDRVVDVRVAPDFGDYRFISPKLGRLKYAGDFEVCGHSH